jgi:hypothetical protein
VLHHQRKTKTKTKKRCCRASVNQTPVGHGAFSRSFEARQLFATIFNTNPEAKESKLCTLPRLKSDFRT